MGKKSKAVASEFEVEELLEFRFNGGRKEYKVKWKGFGEEHATWEPEANMENATEALEAFNLKHGVEGTSSDSKRKSGKVPPLTASRRASMKDDESEGSSSSKRVAKRSMLKPTDDASHENESVKRTRNEASKTGKVWHGSSSRGTPSDDAPENASESASKRPARISFTANKTPAAASSAAKRVSSPVNSNKTFSANRTAAAGASPATRGNQQRRPIPKSEPVAQSGGSARSSRIGQPAKSSTRGGQQQQHFQSPRGSKRAADSSVMKLDDFKEYSNVNIHTLQGTLNHCEIVLDASNNHLLQIDYKLNEKNGKVLRFSLSFDDIKLLHDNVQAMEPLVSSLSQSNTTEYDSAGGKPNDMSSSSQALVGDSGIEPVEGDDELVGGDVVGGDDDLNAGGTRRSSSRRSPSAAAAAGRSASGKRKDDDEHSVKQPANDAVFGEEIETTDDDASKRGGSEAPATQHQKEEAQDAAGAVNGIESMDTSDGGNLNENGDSGATTSRERNADRSSDDTDTLANGHGEAVQNGDGGKASSVGKKADSNVQRHDGDLGGGDMDDELMRGIAEAEAQ